MGKKRQDPTPAEPARSFPVALLVAYGIGLFCVAGGILTLAFGTGHAGQDTGVANEDVSVLGWMLIALGLVAIVVTAAIQWAKR